MIAARMVLMLLALALTGCEREERAFHKEPREQGAGGGVVDPVAG